MLEFNPEFLKDIGDEFIKNFMHFLQALPSIDSNDQTK